MKKVIFLSAGIAALTLMSFANNKDRGIIEVKGNTITVKDTRKISKKDLKFLSENIIGWTYCKQYSENNTCNTMNRTFPQAAEAKAEVQKIIEKYQ